MRVLVAIKTCWKYAHRAEAQRQTWAGPPVEYLLGDGSKVMYDLRFFLGRQPDGRAFAQPPPDTTILNVADDYHSLPRKLKALCSYARNRFYDWVFLVDDDTYVAIPRLVANIPAEGLNYVGHFRGPSGLYPHPYCSTFAMWLSHLAVSVVSDATLSGDYADDRWAGQALARAGIVGQDDHRYVVTHCDQSKVQGAKGDQMEGIYLGEDLERLRGPAKHNDIIACCEFEPAQMRHVHGKFMETQPGRKRRAS